MKIDEEASFSDEIYEYNRYVKENLEVANKLCDELVEQILFYKFIMNSSYNENDLIGNSVHTNFTEIIRRLENIEKNTLPIKELIDYMESEGIELKWKNFESMKMTKEFKREYKLYKLTNKK